jgi:pyruvate formate lyase activating enzyme
MMSKKSGPYRGLSRREALKAVAVGACSLGMSLMSGCAPARPAEELPAANAEPRMGWFRPVRSPWFVSLEGSGPAGAGSTIRCTLCPRQCELAAGERSPCRVRENRNGAGYTLSYANPALVQVDPIERKPFYHVLPASRVMSISTAGCNLACKFCESWDLALVHPEEVFASDLPPKEVIAHAQAAGVQAIGYAFGEPVAFFEYMADVAVLAREAGLLNLVQTAGYIQPEPLQMLVGTVDALNVDLKSFNPDFYRNVVGGELEPVLRTLKLLRKSGVHIEVTNLVIPTLNDDAETIRKMCHWIINELGEGTPLHFARFYPLFQLKALPRTPVASLDQARAIALEAGLQFVYVAKVIGHEGENTFCPQCKALLIKRIGFVIEELALENGQCKYCGASIPGRWA